MNDTTLKADSGRPVRSSAFLLLVLFAANSLALAPSIGFVPLIPQIKDALNLTYTQVGFFSGMAGLAGIVCSLPAGMAIAKFGFRPVMIGGIAVAGVGIAMLAFSSGLTAALATRAIWQCGIRFAVPAAITGVALVTAAKFRGTALGVMTAAGVLTTVAAMSVSSWISTEHGWRGSMTFFAVLLAIAAMIALLGTRSAPRPTIDFEHDTDAVRPGRLSAYRNPWVWGLGLLVVLSCEEGVIDSFAALQMKDKWGTSTTEFSKIASFGLLLAVVVNLLIGILADRIGRWTMVLVVAGTNLLASCMILWGEGDAAPTLYVTGLVIAKSLQLSLPLLMNSMAPGILGPGQAGRIIALTALGASLGQFIGPQMLGYLRDATGDYTTGWWAMSLTCLAAFALALILRRRFPQTK